MVGVKPRQFPCRLLNGCSRAGVDHHVVGIYVEPVVGDRVRPTRCWHYRPIDPGSLHLRNAPNAEAALGRELAGEEIGTAGGVLRPAKAIFDSPVLEILKDAARWRGIEGDLVVVFVDHAGAELVDHGVWREPERARNGPGEVEPPTDRYAVLIAFRQFLGARGQRFPRLWRVCLRAVPRLAPDCIVGKTSPV